MCQAWRIERRRADASPCNFVRCSAVSGGAKETVIAGQTGCFFKSQTPAAIVSAVEQFESESFDPYRIRVNAERFSIPRFRREIEELVSREYEQFQARWRGLSVVSLEREKAARA